MIETSLLLCSLPYNNNIFAVTSNQIVLFIAINNSFRGEREKIDTFLNFLKIDLPLLTPALDYVKFIPVVFSVQLKQLPFSGLHLSDLPEH